MDDVLLNKYTIIQRCLARIKEEYVGYEHELTTNFTRQDSIILNIQRASQAALDIANRVIRLKQLGIPQDSRESFSLLSDHGYAPAPLTNSKCKPPSIGCATSCRKYTAKIYSTTCFVTPTPKEGLWSGT